MKRLFTLLTILLLIIAGFFFVQKNEVDNTDENVVSSNKENTWSTKKKKVKSGEESFMKPDGFIKYFNSVGKRLDQDKSAYRAGYRISEINKSKQYLARRAKSNQLDANFISRGPGNVGGRTRAIAVDPDDASNCTWIAGAASGGIWKTTDCGESWTNISPDLPNLSTNSIDQANSDPNIIYVGTGEVFGGNTTFVRGNGIYKSTDRGQSWQLLPSTTNSSFISVNRIQVDPQDPDIVVIGTNNGIFKSIDGGASWDLKASFTGDGRVQDLQVDPTDYNTMYAGVNSAGVYKSVDAGESWTDASEGINEGIRFEIAVAESNPNTVYASSYVGSTTILYYSDNKGENWYKVNGQEGYNINFLGAQGWYDNTVAVNPYNENEVFVGGVSMGKFLIDPASQTNGQRSFLGLSNAADLVDFVAFNAEFNGGTLDISSGSDAPSQNPVAIEIRFGGTNSQKAHRFTVPEGATSGVAIEDYSYQDYVDVPFEVWDIENNRQLMVSFRDQERNGVFNLNKRSESDDQLSDAREYFYIHDIAYSETADATVAADGRIEFANMYYFWPILAESATWDANSLTTSTIAIEFGAIPIIESQAQVVYDAYGDWQRQNTENLHPDHHHLTLIKTDEQNETFMIVNGNDGGLGISRDNGNTFEQIADGYITTQFYGADKKSGEEKYIGGTQDNGTWVSTGATVDSTNVYNFVIGGDGFEVLWHSDNTDLVLGTIYNNRIQRSNNGAQSFSAATTGILGGDGPFITRLANSDERPDVVFAIGNDGVYKSENFGQNWNMVNIDSEYWGGNASASDVEVSLANPDIVWAGAGMSEGFQKLGFFVSTNGGETFDRVNSYAQDPLAFSTGVYTHPSEDSTAFVLFSLPDSPKILKTEDLGQSWTDISGFETGGAESDNGFPDVFVHSLLVMPFNNDIIWAGTEIGLYESLDGGQSWNIRDDFPSVSIWSMKIVDEEVVIGTHGRGIWSAEVELLAPNTLSFDGFTYQGYGNATVDYTLPVAYDSIELSLDGEPIEADLTTSAGNTKLSIENFRNFSGGTIRLEGFLNGQKYLAKAFNLGKINVAPTVKSVSSEYNEGTNQVAIEVENNEPFDSVQVLFNSQVVYTDYQAITDETIESRIIEFNFDQNTSNSVQLRSFIDGQVFTSLYDVRLITSNSNELSQKFSVYPVPATSYFNFTESNVGIKQVKVFSRAGKLLKTASSKELNDHRVGIESLPSGLLLIQVESQDGALMSTKIIKQ